LRRRRQNYIKLMRRMKGKIESWSGTVNRNPQGNQKLTVKLDTGADCNFISVLELDALKIDRNDMQKSRFKLVTYSGHMIRPLGQQCL